MQTYKIAGLIVEMDIRYDRLKKQAEPYIYKGNKSADMTLVLEPKVIDRAKLKYPSINEEGLEYLLLGALFYDKLLDFDGMMLHASAVAVGQRAYLFSANSGVGKSTHTSYWTELIKGAVIVNDDKPALRFIDGNLYVFGTPFSGKHGISVNRQFLLGGICFLSRGEKNIIEDITPQEALPLILPQTVSMHAEDRVSEKLRVMDKVLTSAKLYKMQCINHISAAQVSYDKMNVSLPVKLAQLLPVMEETLSGGGTVTFITNGNSMVPLLHGKDSVTVKKSDTYKKGDVVLFRKEDGGFVLHRIAKIKGESILTQGDSLLTKDAPIKSEQIVGKAVSFIRNGKEIKITDLLYKLYKLVYMSAIGKKLRLLKRK